MLKIPLPPAGVYRTHGQLYQRRQQVKTNKTKLLVLSAMFAGFSVIAAQLYIPISEVNQTLTLVSIFVAAGILGAKWGFISQAAYVMLGVVGVPAFSGFRGGLGMIVGNPSGGFIMSFAVTAFVTGFLFEKFSMPLIEKHKAKTRNTRSVKISYMIYLIIPMYVGWIITYSFGIAYFIFITGINLRAGILFFSAYYVGDIFKSIAAAYLILRLKPLLKNANLN